MAKLDSKRACIRFYFAGDKLCVMNVSGLQNKSVYEWFQEMKAMPRSPLRQFETGSGRTSIICNEVLDEAFLRSSAGANGIRIVN
jgi:hypothetical protein